MKEIERNTTAELIVQEIIEDITKGKLKPGDHLKENLPVTQYQPHQ